MKRLNQILLSIYCFTALAFYNNVGGTLIPKFVGYLLVGTLILDVHLRRSTLQIPFPVKSHLLFGILLTISYLLLFVRTGQTSQYYLTFIQVVVLFFLIANIVGTAKDTWFIELAFYIAVLYMIGNQLISGRTIIAVDAARTGAEVGNSNDYGHVLNITVMLAFNRILVLKHFGFIKIALFGIIGLVAIEILLFVGSKGAILILLIIIASYTVINIRRASYAEKVIVSIIVSVALYQFYFLFIETSHFERLLMALEYLDGNSRVKEASTKARIGFVELGYHLWIQKPVFGWGFDQFRYLNTVKEGFYSHNNYIELMANNGLAATLCYYSIHAYLIRGFYRLKKQIENDPTMIWCIIMIFCMLILDTNRVSYYSKIYWMHMGLITGIYIQKKRLV